MISRPPDLATLAAGILSGDRSLLARAITLAESRRPEDARRAAELLRRLAPHTGGSLRLGISGPPGAGKSTLIDALGCRLIEAGHRVAVLAVDPSSRVSGGSILGDKTRMAKLAAREEAFIRPSPSGGSLGGVARRTRESLRLCEAAGFDVVLVETVGVGQSEVAVRDLVDVFLLLLLPSSGDDLQGIKRGVMEQADIIAVNKADGDTRPAALRTQADMAVALHLSMGEGPAAWTRQVLACSAASGEGLDEVWRQVLACRAARSADGGLHALRLEQERRWFRLMTEEAVLERVFGPRPMSDLRRRLEEEVASGRLPAEAALLDLLDQWDHPGGPLPA
ncbi:MAG: methylmalonyl Co-A mutase-associated GTPase MeaB [bacterium]|jgi:LAO/AO transport system kinase|nr:methylmalonyl Co-A mutase-associated GTPase MeaB [bacterium]